jgi:hypothetical protein
MSNNIFTPSKIIITTNDSIITLEKPRITVEKNKFIINNVESNIPYNFDLSDTEFSDEVSKEDTNNYTFKFSFKNNNVSDIEIKFNTTNFNSIEFSNSLYTNIDTYFVNIFKVETSTYIDRMYNYINKYENNKYSQGKPFFRSNAITEQQKNERKTLIEPFDKIINYIIEKIKNKIIDDLIYNINNFVINKNPNYTINDYNNDIMQLMNEIISLFIKETSTFQKIIGNKKIYLIDYLIIKNFDNPFVIIISPIFLQGICPKLIDIDITKYKNTSTFLLKFVSNFISYNLEYKTESFDNRNKILNDCVIEETNCPFYNKMLEFLSIFFEKTLIDNFKQNTLNKLKQSNNNLIGSTISIPLVPLVSSLNHDYN